jgi:peptidoglycan hydrolase-like protein with peptidoglycan-binding domain
MHIFTTLLLATIFSLSSPASAIALEESQDDIHCPTITKNIKKGFRDANSNGSVSELQQFLSDYYDIEPGQILTGYFGNVTRGYVIRFQTEQAFPADSRSGIVGTMTRTRIASVCTGTPTTVSSTPSSPLACPSVTAPTCTGTLTPHSIQGCTFYTCTPLAGTTSCVPENPAYQTQSVACPAGQTGTLCCNGSANFL